MDYGYVLKRAWKVTWRHKILWLFGFFVMSGGANYSSSSSSFDSSGTTGTVSPEQFDQLRPALEQFFQWLPLIIGIAVFLLFLALIWWVLSVAARGALIYLVNEAEEGREVRAGAGWRMGFRFWWRIFFITLLLALPMLIIGGLMAVAIIFSVVAGGGFESPQMVLSMVTSICGIVIAGVLLLMIIGFIVGLLTLLASRHAVLGNVGSIESIKRAWNDIKTRFKDVFLMWLIGIGVGIGWAVASGIVLIFFGIVFVVSLIAGAWPIAVLIGFLLFVLLLIANAAYSVFVSAMWTVFFRRLTGMDVPPRREVGPPAGAQPYVAPQQPAYPAPPPVPQPPATPGMPPPQTPPGGEGAPPPPPQGG